MRMPQSFAGLVKNTSLVIASLAMAMAAPVAAQMETIDPNDAIDADLIDPPPAPELEAQDSLPQAPADEAGLDDLQQDSGPEDILPGDPASPADPSAVDAQEDTTYQRDDLIGAAEGVFGKGAEGLAGIIEDILKDQGQPNGYIVGREAGGALVVGLRYGSGKLFHKVEGEQPVYWTGPSIGFDAGANAAKSFTLVYNLYDTEDLYKRYGAGEGAAYFVGGFNASYLRRGDVVLIPVRLGVGVRLGANIGYRKFSKKQRWLPF